jgi:uncharacterized protein YraI
MYRVHSRLAALVLAALTLAVLGPRAAAQTLPAYAAKDAHLRAGPARDYPVVVVVPEGVELIVQGCLSDYSWCDVSVGPQRGWMYAANINYPLNDGYAPLLDCGAQIGMTVVGFSLLDYWGSFYVDRPFYRDRDRWNNRPRPPRSPGAALIRPVPPGAARQAQVPVVGSGVRRPELPQRVAPPPPRAAPNAPSTQRPPRGEPPEREGRGAGQPSSRQGNGH